MSSVVFGSPPHSVIPFAEELAKRAGEMKRNPTLVVGVQLPSWGSGYNTPIAWQSFRRPE